MLVWTLRIQTGQLGHQITTAHAEEFNYALHKGIQCILMTDINDIRLHLSRTGAYYFSQYASVHNKGTNQILVR